MVVNTMIFASDVTFTHCRQTLNGTGSIPNDGDILPSTLEILRPVCSMQNRTQEVIEAFDVRQLPIVEPTHSTDENITFDDHHLIGRFRVFHSDDPLGRVLIPDGSNTTNAEVHILSQLERIDCRLDVPQYFWGFGI